MLWRARQGDQALGSASLADYVYLAEGMAHLAAITQDAEDIAWRDTLIQQAWQRFYTPANGWRNSEKAIIPGIGDQAAQADGALFSPTALLLRLSLQYPQAGLQDKVQQALGQSRAATQQEPLWYATHLLALLDAG